MNKAKLNPVLRVQTYTPFSNLQHLLVTFFEPFCNALRIHELQNGKKLI